MSSQAPNFERNLDKLTERNLDKLAERNLDKLAERNLDKLADLWHKVSLSSNQIILISSDFYNMGIHSDPKRVEEIKERAIQIEKLLTEIKTMAK
ncbi:hypothetical protein OAG24_00475 [bacterium]|nr:hypothetical protein [bacterium]